MTNTIGILTSGGDAPGMNAVIASACRQSARRGAQVFGVLGGFAGLARGRIEPIGAPEARAARARARHLARLESLAGAPRARGGRACLDALEAAGIDALLVIGGHGSARGTSGWPPSRAPRRPPARRARARPRRRLRRRAGDDRPRHRRAPVDDRHRLGGRLALDTIDRLRVTGRSVPGRAFMVQTLGAPQRLPRRRGRRRRRHRRRDRARAPPPTSTRWPPPARAHGQRTAIAVMSEAVGDAVGVSEGLAERAAVPRAPDDPRPRPARGHADAVRPRAGHAAGHAAVDELLPAIGVRRRRRRRRRPASPLLAPANPRADPRRPTPLKESHMTPGYDHPLYILAFDHRTSSQTQAVRHRGHAHRGGAPPIAEAKRITLDGLVAAAEAAPPGTVGALTDEENGAGAARAAKEHGLLLAMSAEKQLSTRSSTSSTARTSPPTSRSSSPTSSRSSPATTPTATAR